MTLYTDMNTPSITHSAATEQCPEQAFETATSLSDGVKELVRQMTPATTPFTATDEAYDHVAKATNNLPDTVKELVRQIGVGAAMALVKAFGGTSIQFSKGISETGKCRYEEVAEVVGYAEADKLACYNDSVEIYIPMCYSELKALRNAEVRRDFDLMTSGDYSAREAVSRLARRYRMSDRNVWRLLKAA